MYNVILINTQPNTKRVYESVIGTFRTRREATTYLTTWQRELLPLREKLNVTGFTRSFDIRAA